MKTGCTGSPQPHIIRSNVYSFFFTFVGQLPLWGGMGDPPHQCTFR